MAFPDFLFRVRRGLLIGSLDCESVFFEFAPHVEPLEPQVIDLHFQKLRVEHALVPYYTG